MTKTKIIDLSPLGTFEMTYVDRHFDEDFGFVKSTLVIKKEHYGFWLDEIKLSGLEIQELYSFLGDVLGTNN